MFDVDLRTQVPMYNAQNPNWGGPACCQMAMDGYPPGATPCYINQTSIWNYIQANNKEGGTGPWGIGWYSDPFAVTKALNDLCPPQHHWIDVSGTNKNEVLYKLLRWMANYSYASLVCRFAHDYWCVVVYYRTSDDPRQVTNPTLESIGMYEPGGTLTVYREHDGWTWMNALHFWGLPCNGQTCGQIWNNKYVGIGEPPEEEGNVMVEVVSRIGETIINPKEATNMARRFLAERRREKSEFLLKRLTGVQAARPILVRELPPLLAKQDIEGDVRYYVVPFVNRYEVDRTGASMARLSVLVNAYTGRFEQLSVFSRPVRYLSEREAVRIASRTLRLSLDEVRRMEVESVFQPLRPHVSSALPAWRITIGDRVLFVTQTGLVFGSLCYPTYRGG